MMMMMRRMTRLDMIRKVLMKDRTKKKKSSNNTHIEMNWKRTSTENVALSETNLL